MRLLGQFQFVEDKILNRKKHQINNFSRLRSFLARRNLLPLLLFLCLFLFCWLVLACDVVLCAQNLFLLKIMNRVKIALITHLLYYYGGSKFLSFSKSALEKLYVVFSFFIKLL